jgi:DNA polymerase III subunit delta'
MWQGIEGHNGVVEQFRRTLQCGRLATSYLFIGPEGIGKFSFALKLAQALLCLNPLDDNPLQPCDRCDSCRMFPQATESSRAEANAAKGVGTEDSGPIGAPVEVQVEGHPDLDIIQCPEGKRSLPIDLFIGDRAHRNQVGLCHNLALRPRFGSRRVAIIDDADLLWQESANALLKTLEEPPPGVLLILIGTSRSRQLPTILSRTQVVRFAPLPPSVLTRLLMKLAVATTADQAERLAALAEGSIGRAQEFATGSLAELREQLALQFVPERFQVVSLIDELGQFVNEAGKEANQRRRRLRAVIRLVVDIFHQQLRLACTGQLPEHISDDLNLRPGASDNNSMAKAQYSAQSQAIAALDRTIEAQQQLDRNANQATLLASWLDDLAIILTTQTCA